MEEDEERSISNGISLFYSWYYLIGLNLTQKDIAQKFEDRSLDFSLERTGLAERLLKIVKEVNEAPAKSSSNNKLLE